MDYARFVRQRRPIWEAFREMLDRSRRHPRRLTHSDLEELAFRYRQVLHDHALAATRYPGTGAARRLAVLALEGTHRLTRKRRVRRSGLLHFATEVFPAAFRRQLPLLGVAAGLFGVAVLAGLALSAIQPALGTLLLGPRAVQGLAEGKLWTAPLVSSLPPAVSTSQIATNNLGVALFAWSGGALAGLVPLYVILMNGFLLGALLGVTLRYSMAGELLTFIAAHGMLEISLLLVAAASGLGLGVALVRAGDQPRGAALREAGEQAAVVLLGCLPWFVVLSLVESRISPSELPPWFKLAVGCSLELLFLGLALAPTAPAAARPGRGDRDE
ncbi:MAG TPA: stage II sporulation protein M [Thermoanaerobaculia bacterium]|nr:stage II sporulation protein M [Thermoanaerobaculia bacterium]